MRHLYLATPTYDGTVATGYCQSLAMTIAACTRAKIALSGPDFKPGPYIDQNRNWLAHRFLRHSQADALLFIDADLTWDENAVVRLYDSSFDVVGGVYPYKADKEGYPVRLLNVHADSYREAVYVPGGFMLIRRWVFDALYDKVPSYLDPSHNAMVQAYFQSIIRDGTAFIGEDVEFCNRWHKAGGKVWCDPDIAFEHTGPKSWTGNYASWLERQPATVSMGPDGTQRVEHRGAAA